MSAFNTIFDLYECFYPYKDEDNEKLDMPQEVITKYKNRLSQSIAFSAGLLLGSQVKEDKLLKLLKKRSK